MRLALGYKTGLPEAFPLRGRISEKLAIYWFANSFYDRNTVVWHQSELRKRYPYNMTYMGEKFDKIDGYLYGFSLVINDQISHFVIGSPPYEDVSFIVGVKE